MTSIKAKIGLTLKKKIGEKQSEIDHNEDRISQLEKSIEDWTMIDKDLDEVYTLKQIPGAVGETYREDGMVVMEYSSPSMEVHELRHGGQNARNELIITGRGESPAWKGGLGHLDRLSMEVDAYKAQFGFSAGSMPKSRNHGGYSFGSINRKYLQGLYDASGNLLYPGI